MKIPFDLPLQVLALINIGSMEHDATRHTLVDKFFADVGNAAMPPTAVTKLFESNVANGPIHINGTSYVIKGNALIRDFSYFDTMTGQYLSIATKSQGGIDTILYFRHSALIQQPATA